MRNKVKISLNSYKQTGDTYVSGFIPFGLHSEMDVLYNWVNPQSFALYPYADSSVSQVIITVYRYYESFDYHESFKSTLDIIYVFGKHTRNMSATIAETSPITIIEALTGLVEKADKVIFKFRDNTYDTVVRALAELYENIDNEIIKELGIGSKIEEYINGLLDKVRNDKLRELVKLAKTKGGNK